MRISFSQIKKDIYNNKYRYIGSGSGREVYDLGNGYVVKAAKNKKGLAQNKAEYRISASSDSGLFARIKAVSDDYIFLIMEKADSISYMPEVWDYFGVKSNSELQRIKEIKKITKKYDLVNADFFKANNWGIINGRCVIVDYGFTRSVRKKYYWRRLF